MVVEALEECAAVDGAVVNIASIDRLVQACVEVVVEAAVRVAREIPEDELQRHQHVDDGRYQPEEFWIFQCSKVEGFALSASAGACNMKCSSFHLVTEVVL